MKIEPSYARDHRDATRAAAPEDRPRGHGGRADAGHAEAAGGCPRAARSRSRRRCPTSSSTRSSRRWTATRATTCGCWSTAAADGLEGDGDDLARHDPALRAERALRAPHHRRARRRAARTSRRDPQLLAARRGARREGRPARAARRHSNAVFPSFAAQDANLRATLRSCRRRSRATQTALGKVDDAGARARPDARATCGPPPARSARRCARRGRSCARRRRSSATSCARSPATRCRRSRELRPAVRDLAAVTPDLTATFKVLNYLLNGSPTTRRARPRRATSSGSRGPTTWRRVFATQDAHGPIRRGMRDLRLPDRRRSLDAVGRGQPAARAPLVDLRSTARNRAGTCPASSQEPGGGGRLMQKQAPTLGRMP